MNTDNQTNAVKAPNDIKVNVRQLPPALKVTLKPYPEDFHMPILVGLMPALAALADGVTYEYCNGKIHHMALFAFILGEQSDNKSVIDDTVEMWIAPLRKEDKAIRDQEDATAKQNLTKKANERGQLAPDACVRTVPITISIAKLLQRQINGKGHSLYSMESEADTLLKTNGAGSWSAKYDIYRKAWDHALFGQDYMSVNSQSGNVEAFYSWTICGQACSFLKMYGNENASNGLSSRTMLSEMPDNSFRKMPKFKKMSEADLKLVEEGINTLREAKGFKATPRLNKAIDNWVEQKRLEAVSSLDTIKDIYRRRAAVIGFRCGVIFMLLVGKESNACIDFALAMAEYTLQNQCRLFGPLLKLQNERVRDKMPKATVNENVLQELPSPFTIDDLRKLKGNECADGTLYSIISRWKAEGWIEKKDKNSWTKTQTLQSCNLA
ncbi:MAG: DUF3987 domain-containing protein [Prevotella sp.]|nr:DUF3987 domain-containing protein [Prevotella sp.]